MGGLVGSSGFHWRQDDVRRDNDKNVFAPFKEPAVQPSLALPPLLFGFRAIVPVRATRQ